MVAATASMRKLSWRFRDPLIWAGCDGHIDFQKEYP